MVCGGMYIHYIQYLLVVLAHYLVPLSPVEFFFQCCHLLPQSCHRLEEKGTQYIYTRYTYCTYVRIYKYLVHLCVMVALQGGKEHANIS